MNSQVAPAFLSNSTVYRSNGRGPHRSAANVRRSQDRVGTWIDAAAFDRFLCWLGPDLESAAEKYESIRGRLIMMFRARKCVFAEDLADVTFERVARKLTDRTFALTGDPARYFYGVAKKIYLEHQRRLTATLPESALASPANLDEQNQLDQLEEALNTIAESDRDLILKYYAGSGQTKIDHRRALAAQFGIGPNALRLRVFRIRTQIKKRMLECDAAA